MNYIEDEFEVYDSCTADALEKGDIIMHEYQLVEIVATFDNLLIDVAGYAIDWEEQITFSLDPESMHNLYRYKD